MSTQKQSSPNDPKAGKKIPKSKERRHVSWALNKPPKVFSVEVPKRNEKAKYWFESSEQFVVIPRHIEVPAGEWVQFQVSSRLRAISIHAIQRQDATAPAKGTTLLEVSTEAASTEEASRELEALYGVQKRTPFSKTNSDRPLWLTVGRVAPGRSVKINHCFAPGLHKLRANGESNVLIMALASGMQMKLQ